MASTGEGRDLTAAHRDAQIRIGAATIAEATALWGRLDINDLDGSTPYWLALNARVVNRRMVESQRVAGEYLTEYRQAEIGQPATVRELAPTATAQQLRAAGPVRVKQLIIAGMGASEAYDHALTKFAGVASRQALMGGRLTVAATTSQDRRAIGWRRVTDGNPCTFCALLASRGPAYRSASTGDGLRYHAHCGCTAEPVYTTWTPNAEEQSYLDAYRAADGNNLRTITRSMRRNGSFRDSPRT